MKLKDCREAYSNNSRKTSEIVRQLGFAGIALIWVFKYQHDGKIIVPNELFLPGIFIVIGLGLDLLQSASGTAIWGIFHRHKEKSTGITEDTEFLAPRAINWTALVLFWSKVTMVCIAYVFLIRYLLNRIV